MEIREAAGLIRCPEVDGARADWCDLGCGVGIFTLALAELLEPGSAIYAVDRDRRALALLPKLHHGVSIRAVEADFTQGYALPAVNGVLMANSLHFAEDQRGMLRMARTAQARLLIVEYETSAANAFCPYPIGYARLCDELAEAGYATARRIGVRPSRFGGVMYAAWADVSPP